VAVAVAVAVAKVGEVEVVLAVESLLVILFRLT
jgi:hypothetical protein